MNRSEGSRTSSDVTDEQLAEALRRRDRDALAILADRYYGPLVRYLWQAGGSREDAEDLASQTLLKVRDEIGTYRHADAFRGWIFRIAYRQLLMHRRRRALALRWFRESAEPISSGPIEDAWVVQEALARLHLGYRAALLLVEVEGLTIQEAADALGIPPGTVKSRCHHARARLRVLLAPTFLEVQTHAQSASD